jgi:amino acid adenylation domain-containing protein
LSGRTFAEDLTRRAAADGERVALIAGEERLTFAELDERATRLADGLRELGVNRGDRVAVVLPNVAAAAVAIYGVLRSGAAFSPVNPTTKVERLAQLLDDLGAAAVVCDASTLETSQAAAGRAGAIPVVAGPDDLPTGHALASPSPLEVDLAAVIYTSGSTGEPKGVTLTHRNMTFVADSIIEYLRLTSDDRILCVLPLSFNYGLYQLLMAVRVGATLVLEAGFAFPGRVVKLLIDERITSLPGVPTVFQTLVSLKGIAERGFPDLRFITNAGAALPEATVRAVRETFEDADLYLMYGQTEATRVAYLPPELVDDKPTAVGIAIPGTEVWIEDDEGDVLGAGEVGELFVRGPHVMQGYWNDPEGTAVRLRPGRWPWERTVATNDLFRFDGDGHLHFVGRRDDVIKSRGEKVAPREIEEILMSADGVREAAVVGVPDELLGEAVIAHVAPRPGIELDATELRRLCASRLEDYKVPRLVEVHPELPRTGNGKVDRRALAAVST